MDSITNLSSLDQVKPFKSSWRVQVKVLHTWVSFSHQKGASLEMVLADKNGVKIHAICKQSLLQQLEKHFVVGQWIICTNFTLRAATGFNRPTNNVYKMEFMDQTSITDCDFTCNEMFLDLKNFSNILNGSHDDRFLNDVIGEVLDYGGTDMVQFARKEVSKMEFTLRDIDDQRLHCCIWGKLSQILTQDGKQPNNGDICLIRFAKSCICKGVLQLCNSFDTSLVFINPNIEEAHALKQKFRGDDNILEMFQPVNTNILIKEKRLKWSQYPFRTIQEMRGCDEGEKSRVICSVYAIDTFSGWYYCACVVCQNEVLKQTVSFVENDVPSWWCLHCQRIVAKVSTRYKLDLLVQDQTGLSKFTLAESVAESILNVSAAKFVNILGHKMEAQDSLPPEILAIVGKSYGFGITVDGNKSVGSDNFNAIKVWSLDDILLKRIKSLHQNSTNSRKKHCTNVGKIEESG